MIRKPINQRAVVVESNRAVKNTINYRLLQRGISHFRRKFSYTRVYPALPWTEKSSESWFYSFSSFFYCLFLTRWHFDKDEPQGKLYNVTVSQLTQNWKLSGGKMAEGGKFARKENFIFSLADISFTWRTIAFQELCHFYLYKIFLYHPSFHRARNFCARFACIVEMLILSAYFFFISVFGFHAVGVFALSHVSSRHNYHSWYPKIALSMRKSLHN